MKLQAFRFFFSFHLALRQIQQPSLACPSSQLVKIQSQEHKKKQTAPVPQAMIDSIKSNSATVAHFKVNLSQHFDMF